jgi:hypothetical protein
LKLSDTFMRRLLLLLADVAASVDRLSLAGKRNSGPPPPYCIANDAVPENLLQRVEPAAIGPKFVSIPRMIVDPEGGVKHIHVIRATDEL